MMPFRFLALLLAWLHADSLAGGLRLNDDRSRSRLPECSPLKNLQTHSTVEVKVGTPPQTFSLVADTGSSNVIITHCDCFQHHCKGYAPKCFKGAGSSSFGVQTDSYGVAPAVQLTFGSGTIYSTIGSDFVGVGKVSAPMNNSLLLMYDNELDDDIIDLEGIFGLGLPSFSAEQGGSWLTRASVDRFSMCFSSLDRDGVLKLNTRPQSKALGNLGKVHWALDFRGVSVGDETAPVAFCSPESKSAGQTSTCGMIPDSGTTLLMGPESHIISLYAQLCDRWPRCSKAYAAQVKPQADDGWADLIKNTLESWGIPAISNPFAADPLEQEKLDKKYLLEQTLANCSSWATDAASLDDELPPIYFHVAGSEGKTDTLALKGSGYVVSGQYGGKDVCMPFFGAYEYHTLVNGPIWIIGTPLFYEYEVHYDVSSTPPSMSFSQDPCGSCAGEHYEADANFAILKGMRSKAMRRQQGKVRMPSLDKNAPL